MKLLSKPLIWIFLFSIGYLTLNPGAYADTLFSGREIYLNNYDNSQFRIGITGATAGHNYLALIEDAKQESISLSDLGYWELVSDPPSALRNFDLQMIVKNNYKGNFQIEFKYNKEAHGINYQIKSGAIEVTIDDSSYYPTLIIDGIKSVARMIEDGVIKNGSNNLVFFDFNSFDVDLRKHYGSIKKLIRETTPNHYFYYYESGDYNSYYFKTYDDVAKLDTDKMGLSLEDGSLEYYHKILDNLKSRFGTQFADRIIIISRFGDKYSNELEAYAYETGLGKKMEVMFWSYDQIR